MRASLLLLASIGALGVVGCSRSGLELLGSGARAVPDGGVMDSGVMDADLMDASTMDSGNPDGPCEWRFAPAAEYTVSGYPVDVVIGDFDGDHANDVLTVNATSGEIALLGNRGNGELTLRAKSRAGTSPYGFAAADFTGDGALDLAVLYQSPGMNGATSVSIYRNDGNGTFNSEVAYLTVGGAFGIVAGDFDGDRRADVAIAGGAMSVFLLINTGGGIFRIGPTYPTGSYSSYLTATDFNQDGTLDLAIAGSFSAAVLLNGGGNADFLSPEVYNNTSACDYVGPLVAGDLTGDGYPDLVRSCYQGGSVVAVRINAGDGSLGNELPYGTGQWPFRLVMGDFTGHGRNDLAVANSWAYANSVSVLPNQGDGTFASALTYEAAGPMYIAAGDLNGDGHPDLATAGSPETTGTVSVLLSVCE